ncbi:MAG: TerB family tellurite resistance protein [Phocaeicola sp.]|uniref:TerB family tellurite resistance protein n=1 Tax=Phocaeicola TaxID=909656 RepID=UPI00234EFE4B|nr:TerB family tellurite resistance protein [Phocaeicola oris]MCE2616026.1 DnaJ domain-containing protein [Phocaeicola oris]
MSTAKWIGGILGFMTFGPLGALAGYFIGSLFDDSSVSFNGRTFGDSSGGYSQQQTYQGQRNSFLFSMLVLASYVIKADGKIMHSEMEYVRNFLRMNFGEAAVDQGEKILKNLFEQQKQMDAKTPGAFKNTIRDCSRQIAANLDYSQRLQLLDFLVRIAQSDGKVSQEEITALKELAGYMQVSDSEVDSLLNLGGNTLEDAYKVLEISPSATDDEVRAAYRKLALKHHPDKVATLGEDVRKAAEQKFQEINNAKERIYKARGIK